MYKIFKIIVFQILLFSFNLSSQVVDSLSFDLNQKNGLTYFKNKNYKDAIDLFEINYKYLEEFEDTSIYINKYKYSYLTYLKDCSIALKKYEDAINYSKKGIYYYKNINDTISKVFADKYAELSRLNSFIFNYEQAIKYQNLSLNLNKKIFGLKSNEYLLSLTNLGIFYDQNGDYIKSKLVFEESSKISNELFSKKDSSLYIYEYDLIKSIFYNEEYDEAIRLGRINLNKIKSNIGTENHIYCEYLNLISLMYLKNNEISNSIEYNLESEQLTKKLFSANSQQYYNTQVILSEINNKIGNSEISLKINIKNLQLCNFLYGNESHEMCLQLKNIATDYLRLNNKDSALLITSEAVKIAKIVYNQNDINYINLQGLVVQILLNEGLYSDAINTNKIILNYYKPIMKSNLNAYVNYLANQAYLNQVINDSNEASLIYNEIISILDTSDFINERTKNSIFFDYLVFCINQKEFTKADSICSLISFQDRSYFQKNILYLDDEQKSNFQNIWYSHNNLIIDYSIQRDNSNFLKIQYTESLNYYFSNIESTNPIKNKKIDILHNELTQSKNTLSYFLESNQPEIKIDSIKSIIKKIKIDLQKVVSKTEYSQINYLNKIKNQLGESDVFIHISKLFHFDFSLLKKYDSSYYLITIIKSNQLPDFIILNNESELQSFNFQMQNANKNFMDSTFFISSWLPIQNKLNGQKNIYLFLDGEFNKMNFNTIYNPRAKKYLIEDYQFSYVTSITDFINKNDNSEKLYNFTSSTLIGNPNFNYVFQEKLVNQPISNNTELISSRDLSIELIDTTTRGYIVKPLPNTKIEIQNIEKILKSNNIVTTIYTEDEANESNLKITHSPSILHIATHGYFVEDEKLNDLSTNTILRLNKNKLIVNPLLRSGLVLSGANSTLKGLNTNSLSGNGLFTAYEASALDLSKTELVVLSACETGRGKILNGQGVIGLRKGFKDAGAKNIIMSLWKVDDKVTQEFMTSFYALLFSGESIKSAFYKTQIQIKENYNSPYYWGAFILSEY